MIAIWLIGGFVTLIVGAQMLIRGATALARAMGMPPLIIGLTIVAFGTSAPELAVSIKAGLAGQADIALGNVLGSNTFNVLFILGISALVAPLTVSSQLVRLDVPVMIGISVLVWALAWDGNIGRGEGIALTVLFCAYTILLIYLGKRKSPTVESTDTAIAEPPRSLTWPALLVPAGLVLLVAGSSLLVGGTEALARLFGVSELVIGLTIVATGTSLPEVATSLIAGIQGRRDLAVGNVVGSNIFNLLAVLGGAAIAGPQGVSIPEAAMRFDIPAMLAASIVCLPIFFTGGRISRWEGGLFLGYYIAYVTLLILTATHHSALANYQIAMIWFVIPLTLLAVTVSVLTWLRRRRSSKAART